MESINVAPGTTATPRMAPPPPPPCITNLQSTLRYNNLLLHRKTKGWKPPERVLQGRPPRRAPRHQRRGRHGGHAGRRRRARGAHPGPGPRRLPPARGRPRHGAGDQLLPDVQRRHRRRRLRAAAGVLAAPRAAGGSPGGQGVPGQVREGRVAHEEAPRRRPPQLRAAVARPLRLLRRRVRPGRLPRLGDPDTQLLALLPMAQDVPVLP
uniref:Polyphenol oxidase n=1 Tax=Oryza sativa subsp. japonica TaxID=39947 RepID=A5X3K4_ORYSJ|nr:polyphenol oxidase [Oryza sativa Japonica Group]